MTLFEIDAEIRSFLDSLYEEADEDGVVKEVDFDRLEALNEARQEKLESVALYYKELKAEAEAISAEAKKLAQRAKAAENRAESFKQYLATSMQKNGEDNVTTSRVKITFRKSEKVVVDELKIPRKFMLEKVEWVPDKKEIKRLLKEGQDIDGARLEVNQNIQIN